MSTIYRCVECEMHYCADCDGGEDTCDTCHVGPWCPDCISERTHDPETDDDDSDALPLCVKSMRRYCAGHARGNAASEPCDTREE